MAIGRLPVRRAGHAASIVMDKLTDPADKFAQRYMFTKCVEMVKAYRSHPSVIEYCVQNEIGADAARTPTPSPFWRPCAPKTPADASC